MARRSPRSAEPAPERVLYRSLRPRPPPPALRPRPPPPALRPRSLTTGPGGGPPRPAAFGGWGRGSSRRRCARRAKAPLRIDRSGFGARQQASEGARPGRQLQAGEGGGGFGGRSARGPQGLDPVTAGASSRGTRSGLLGLSIGRRRRSAPADRLGPVPQRSAARRRTLTRPPSDLPPEPGSFDRSLGGDRPRWWSPLWAAGARLRGRPGVVADALAPVPAPSGWLPEAPAGRTRGCRSGSPAAGAAVVQLGCVDQVVRWRNPLSACVGDVSGSGACQFATRAPCAPVTVSV
ncbi:hypothetical protein LRR80_03829 [Streptomyces sp. RO-S4]|nr:hypothetical protein [Streptomyces sp. RO-S4]